MRLVKRQIFLSLVIACVGFSIIAVHDFWTQRIIVNKINSEDDIRIGNAVKVHFDTIIAQSMKQIELIASFPYINYIAQQDGFRKYKMIQLAANELEKLSKPLSFFSDFRLIQVQDGQYEEIIKLRRYGKSDQLLLTHDLGHISDSSEIDLWKKAAAAKAEAKIDSSGNIRIFFTVVDPLDGDIFFVVEGKILMSEIMASLNHVAAGYQTELCDDSHKATDCIHFGYLDNNAFYLKRITPPLKTNVYQWLSFFLVLIFAIALSLSIALLLAKRNIRPAVRLIDYTKALRNNLETETSPFDDELGDVWKALNEFVDRIKDRENELRESASLVAIGHTTAMVAHDVRKPLTSMKALLMTLDDIKNDPEQLKDMMAAVDRNIAHTNAMLDDILDFSRDATSLKVDEINPQGIMTSALSDVFRKHQGLAVKVAYDFGHQHSLKVDSERITRVLANIIDNSIDAMEALGSSASAEILLKTYEIGREGKNYVGIIIADSGPGVPEYILPKLFDPFFTHGKKGGTGLGLAICQRIITMHGGRIESRNRIDGRGAEFVVELSAGDQLVGINEEELIHNSLELKPFRDEEAQRVEYGDAANTAQFMRINKEKGRPSYLLIVDDEPLFRETVRSLFGNLGQVKDHVKIVEADSAEIALELFRAREFDYVISDIDMGKRKMNGYEFSQIVLEKYHDTHVLIHSNKRRGELDKNIRQVASDKFLGFLPKPMKASELLQFLACKTFEAPDQKKAENAERGSERKVLVVNDDEAMLVMFRMMLKSSNVQVLQATNVSAALKIMAEQGIDVILSDINLGNGEPDGYDFLKHVREKSESIPFFMVSGFSRSDEEPKAKKHGATGYLQLPVDQEEILRVLGG